MTWYNPFTWFGGITKPPKPEDKSGLTQTRSVTVYETEVEYLNGDTETITHYGKGHNEDRLTFKIDFEYGGVLGTLRQYSRHRQIHHSVLARDPITEPVYVEEYTVTYDITHRYSYVHNEWEERIKQATAEQTGVESVEE